MLVSVLMPTFNVAPYVRTAVDSILRQTHRELELLIQDDGSTDGTLAIVQDAANSDNRVRMLPAFSSNRGVVAARNALVQSATGDFIAWMDSDDVSLPERLKTQIEFLERQPQFGAVGTAIQYTDANGTPREVEKFPPEPEKQATRPDICCASVMARRAASDDAGLFREVFSPGGEDQDWLLKMADKHKITNVDRVLYLYRRHGGLFARNRPAIDRLGVLARYAARVRRRGEPDPIDSLVPDKNFHDVRDELFLNNSELDQMEKLEALGRPLPDSTPLLSVLIPYHDDDLYFFEKYLVELSRQTFRNFEVVIHDDGSKRPVDENWVRGLLPGIPLKVIRSPVPQGQAQARDLLLKSARGAMVS